MKCPVCDYPLKRASHELWDYDCPQCQRSYKYSEGYLYSKFETIPRKFKVDLAMKRMPSQEKDVQQKKDGGKD